MGEVSAGKIWNMYNPKLFMESSTSYIYKPTCFQQTKQTTNMYIPILSYLMVTYGKPKGTEHLINVRKNPLLPIS